jgi:hypothetical protein
MFWYWKGRRTYKFSLHNGEANGSMTELLCAWAVFCPVSLGARQFCLCDSFYQKSFVFQFAELVLLPKCQAKWTSKKRYCSSSLEHVISNLNIWPQIQLSCTDYRATTWSQLNSLSNRIMRRLERLEPLRLLYSAATDARVSEMQSPSLKTMPFNLQACFVSCLKCTMSYAPSDYFCLILISEIKK